MENFDLQLEEQELDLASKTETNNLKEYEKLLIIEKNRKEAEKAINLIKFGCFEQKEVETINFSELELVEGAKKYRGAYKLYRNVNTFELLYVLPLVEDNKGDENERTDLAPYAYDVIYLEQMDAETYKVVSQAAKRNLPTMISRLYLISWIIMIAYWVMCLVYGFYTGFTSQYPVVYTLIMITFNFFSNIFYTVPVMLVITYIYKKFKEEK